MGFRELSVIKKVIVGLGTAGFIATLAGQPMLALALTLMATGLAIREVLSGRMNWKQAMLLAVL